MVDFAGRLRQRLAERLKGQFVTIAVDGGKVHKKLQTVSVLMGGNAYFLKSTKVLHNDHQTILDVVVDAQGTLESAGAIICAIVGDNHTGVQKAIQIFCEKNPKVMCFSFSMYLNWFIISIRFSKFAVLLTHCNF
jgi:hypothetical protein